MPVLSFKDSRIWREAHALTLRVYECTGSFPRDERFGLVAQFRRASVSVAANIVEGMGRKTRKDFLHFLVMARGSAKEATYYCILARDLRFLDESIATELERRYTGLDAGIFTVIDRVGNKK